MRRNQESADICREPGEHRALSALISLSFAVTLGATSVGCSEENIYEGADSSRTPASEHDAAEDALIQAHLEDQGYDTSTLRFEGDAVVVEDDMLMSRPVLLREAEAAASGVVDKGYFIVGPLFAGKRVALSFESAVSSAWRTAVTAARDRWNNAIPLVRDPGPAGTITVQVRALTDKDGNPLTGVIAQGSIPSVGRIIQLNSNFINRSADCGGTNAKPVTIETLSANRKAFQALHEMGHVLGFAHPPPNPTQNARVHIDGTATNTGLLEPSYETVMAQGCGTRTTLTPDDILSAQKKYPSCVTKCENDCTVNVDPAQIGLCQANCPAQCGG